jgi:hypothetical protein
MMSLFSIFLLVACGGDDVPPASTKNVTTSAVTEASVLPRSPAAAGARVFFITPENGAVVPTTFAVTFGVEGMAVVRAGDNAPNSGHHHLLIDTGLPDLTLPIPADANHVHFGDGSTTTERTLPPGKHTLQLLFADYLHKPHDPPVFSDPITITVE